MALNAFLEYLNSLKGQQVDYDKLNQEYNVLVQNVSLDKETLRSFCCQVQSELFELMLHDPNYEQTRILNERLIENARRRGQQRSKKASLS